MPRKKNRPAKPASSGSKKAAKSAPPARRKIDASRPLPVFIRWLDDGRPTMAGIAFGLLAFILPLIIYWPTLMREPGVHGDYVKFVMLAKVWGIPHPSGFPLYLILSGLWWFLPISPPTLKIALMSAVFASLAIHFLYRSCRLLGFPSFLSFGLVMLIATGKSVWMQAIIPEVYALHILLIIASVWALVKWDSTDDDRYFLVAIWLYILSLANHPTSLFCLPGLIAFALLRKPRVLARGITWGHVAGAVLVVAALYGYIFVRSMYSPLHNEGSINGGIHRFINYLLAKDYRQEWSYYSAQAKEDLWNQLILLARLALTPLGLFAAVLGAFALLFRSWKHAVLFVLTPAGPIIATFLYHTSEPESYFSVTFPFGAFLIGSLIMIAVSLIDRLMQPAPSRTPRPLSATSLIVLVLSTGLLIPGILTQYDVNTKENKATFAAPMADYARAKRILTHISTPAIVFTSHYRLTMELGYANNVDNLLPPRTVAGTQTWNADVARNGLSNGKHVYVFAEVAPQATRQFALVPVNTGTDPPELYELRPKSP